MLASFSDARAEAFGGGGAGGRATSRINSFDPATWTRSYQELDRVLEHLRYLAGHGRPMIARDVSSSTAWWSIRARYLDAKIVRREVHLRKTHTGNRVPILPANSEIASRATILNGRTCSMMLRVWDGGVQPRVVDATIGWIDEQFKGRPDATYHVTD
jgi:hypothetical protein